MEKQVEQGLWIEVDGPNGVDAFPADLVAGHWAWDVGTTYARPENATEDDNDTWELMCQSVSDYTENREIWTITIRKGYGARLSAPGYMDCTPWSVFDSAEEAEEYLAEQYGDEDEDEESAE